MAALMTPCGVSQIWRRRSVSAPRFGAGCAPPFAPRVLAADDLDGPLIGRERLGAAALRRMFTLRAQHVEPHGRRLVVDGGRVGLHLEAWPRPAGGVRLPVGVIGPASGKLDGVQVRRAHRIGGGRDAGFLAAAGERHGQRKTGQQGCHASH